MTMIALNGGSGTEVFVHPQGICESQTVGTGTRVWAFAHVMPGAVIGKSCNIGEQCFVEGGARIGDGCTIKNGVAVWTGVDLSNNVFVGPAASFTNDRTPRAFLKKGPAEFSPTKVGEGATIGANATIICGVTIGAYAFVAAGAVVTRDVAPHALVAGNPARVLGLVCRCGERAVAEKSCTKCGYKPPRATKPVRKAPRR